MTDDADKPRRLPRFSLRSLILFVTLAGSGYGLWVRWEPWSLGSYEPMPKRRWCGLWCYAESPDGEYEVREESGGPERDLNVRDLQTGEIMATLYRGDDLVCNAIYINSSTISVRFPESKAIWHRRRPEYWYGPAWLPEFWLTVVFGVGLLWSVWKDQRSFRPATSTGGGAAPEGGG